MSTPVDQHVQPFKAPTLQQKAVQRALTFDSAVNNKVRCHGNLWPLVYLFAVMLKFILYSVDLLRIVTLDILWKVLYMKSRLGNNKKLYELTLILESNHFQFCCTLKKVKNEESFHISLPDLNKELAT